VARTLASRMQTEDQFKTLLTTLSNDLGRVNDYLTLLRNLAEAQRGAYWRGMSQSQAFWSTVMRGLHDAALHGLARAYDHHADLLTLTTLLEVIDANPSFLTRPTDFDVEQLRNDVAFVHRDTNSAVARLRLWRNKFLAHRDAGKILDSWTLAEDAPLTDEDVKSLVENGFAILNRYGFALFNTGTTRDVHGHEDYVRVLKTLQESADTFVARFEEQLRRAKEEEAARVVSTPSLEPGTSGTSGTSIAADSESTVPDEDAGDPR
jgi:AbiU2